MSKENLSFEQALNAASIWCNDWDKGELSEHVLAERIYELLTNINGARGFFVISLSSDSPLMDRLPDPLIYKFREFGEIIVDLTVKNLIMSSAQIVIHDRENNLEYKSNSENISERCRSWFDGWTFGDVSVGQAPLRWLQPDHLCNIG